MVCCASCYFDLFNSENFAGCIDPSEQNILRYIVCRNIDGRTHEIPQYLVSLSRSSVSLLSQCIAKLYLEDDAKKKDQGVDDL